MSNEGVKNLKVGDLVFVVGRWGKQLRKVENITKAGNIKVNGILFNSSGYERTRDTWNRVNLEEANEESIKEYRNDLLIKKAHKLMSEAKKITIEQALKIIKILGEQK